MTDVGRAVAAAFSARDTFQYFEACTYFGPDREKYIAAANSLVPGGFIGFADWARLNMKQSPASARRGSQEA